MGNTFKVSGVTHLVKLANNSLMKSTEEKEIDNTTVEIKQNDPIILSRRGPNNEIFGDYDEFEAHKYHWYRVQKVGNEDVSSDPWYIRDDAIELFQEDKSSNPMSKRRRGDQLGLGDWSHQGIHLQSDIGVFEKKSGITQEHIKSIQKVCSDRNIFLFIRPTEYASTRLIKSGFATKSMDIHHKSSDWGPMAGAVPVDPAFNKKLGATAANQNKPATPSRDPLTIESNAEHGAAKHVQLSLSDELLQNLIRDNVLTAQKDDQSKDCRVVYATDKMPDKFKFILRKPDEASDWSVYWNEKIHTKMKSHFMYGGIRLMRRLSLSPVITIYGWSHHIWRGGSYIRM